MTWRFPYLDACPNHEALVPRLRELLTSGGADADIELAHVEAAAAAERERFLRLPSGRIDGADVEPGAGERTDLGLGCRLFPTAEGLHMRDDWRRSVDRSTAERRTATQSGMTRAR
jgi:hypothetical protein